MKHAPVSTFASNREPHVMVRMQNNQWVECVLKETIYSSFSLLAQVAVKALHGRPFEGNNIAIVPSHRISFITNLREK
jgi:hypothetical protein